MFAKVFASNSYLPGLHFAFSYTHAVMKHCRLVRQLCVPEVGSLNCDVFRVHIYVRLLEDVTDVPQYDVDCLRPKTQKATRFLCSTALGVNVALGIVRSRHVYLSIEFTAHSKQESSTSHANRTGS